MGDESDGLRGHRDPEDLASAVAYFVATLPRNTEVVRSSPWMPMAFGETLKRKGWAFVRESVRNYYFVVVFVEPAP